MRKISFGRYSAVNRKTLFTALACALLMFSMLGCGMSNKLQTIQVTASLINGQAPTNQTGVYSLEGNGGTIQLAATGTYSDTKTKDLTNVVPYSVIVDPQYSLDAFDNPLLPPCVAPCQTEGQGTVEYNSTGLITAVSPATCTWVDPVPAPGTASWFYVGDYKVTVSYQGITSQPVFIPIASSAGNPDYIFVTPNLINNNPSFQCGPSASS